MRDAVTFQSQPCVKTQRGDTFASIVASFAKEGHRRVLRVLSYALTLADADGWNAFSIAAARHLSDEERACMALSILRTLPTDDAEKVADAVLGGAGMPITILGTTMEQAAFWADRASPNEKDAYCLATFNAMQKNRQAAFRAHVLGGVV
ncbi:hypothetical protein [Pseudoruegeria sp. SK021]|uniref:hypothetical protein n=1 Tax=Pseudoruegeria sp. SK021 TaxID=1933035 RepID=UPI00111BF556|nr:hypothetical protein [Pseudoruegeria sp. SK021]